MNQDDLPRRDFVKQAAIAGVAASTVSAVGAALLEPASAATVAAPSVVPNMIGGYGPWAAGIVGEQPAKLSFLQDRFGNVDGWRQQARARVLEMPGSTQTQSLGDVRIESTSNSDGLTVQRISWQLAYGPRTQAVRIETRERTRQVTGGARLHDHGGNKYFGHGEDHADIGPAAFRHGASSRSLLWRRAWPTN